jgi:hypothetical protein
MAPALRQLQTVCGCEEAFQPASAMKLSFGPRVFLVAGGTVAFCASAGCRDSRQIDGLSDSGSEPRAFAVIEVVKKHSVIVPVSELEVIETKKLRAPE